MFKLTVKFLAFTLLLTAGLLFISGSKGVSALSNNCVGAPYSSWGNAGAGEGDGLMGSLMVQAVDSNNNPVNVNYTLNSDLRGNSDPNLNKRIFQWPIGTGRDSEHIFKTGDHISNGGNSGWDCNGWSVLGPGLQDHAGNGWVVDCGGGGSGAGSSEFWISHVDTPNNAAGTWKLINVTNGQVLSNDVNHDGSNVARSGVINGGNVQFKLVWQPSAPISGNVTASCPNPNIIVSGVNDSTGSGQWYVVLTNSNGNTPNRFPSDPNNYYTGNGRTLSVPDWVKNRRGDTDVGVQLYVLNSDGNSATLMSSANIKEPWSGCTPPNPPPNGATCPSFPTEPTYINLDNHDVPQSDNFNPNGASKPHGKDAHIFTPTGKYHIHTVYDNYGQDISSPNPHWAPNGSEFYPNSFSLNYSPFIADYPYDSHSVTVEYKAQFTDQKYSTVGAYHSSNGTWDWKAQGGPQLKDTQQYWGWYSSKAGPSLGECYDRGFEVKPLTANSQLQGATDNPSGVSFGFNVPVDTFLPNGNTAVRHPLTVCGLSYSASYYIKNDVTGYKGPLASHPGDGGGLPCMSTGYSPGSTSFGFGTGPYGVSGLQAGDQICVDFSVSPGGDRMNENAQITNATPGVATYNNCSSPVLNEPYFKVYNSGISAGGNFDCSPSSGGLLAGWNDNTGADRGASAQLSALATIKSSGVASAQTAAGRSPTDLTFANSGAVSITSSNEAPDLGGEFGGNACLTDVQTPQNASRETSGNVPVSGLSNSAHDYSSGVGSNITLNSGGIADNTNPSMFVTGHDVYIRDSGNHGITYSGGPWTVTNTSTNVPSFTLVVTGGNIYIDPNITELDGTYVAKKDASGKGGTIFTCGDPGGLFAPMIASSLYQGCSKQLKVYGSFVGNQINLMRTYGSLRNATAGEDGLSGAHFCEFNGGFNVNTNCAAEVFIFSPEMYLSRQNITPPNGGGLQETARSNLPPVL